MDFGSPEQRLRKFIHVEALLKHMNFAPPTDLAVPAVSTASTQQLIEDVSRSQADKWRRYAQSGNGRPYGSQWSNAS